VRGVRRTLLEGPRATYVFFLINSL
jgi:hypothetical protein